MKIEFELRDVGHVALYESILGSMPNVQPEELEKQTKELGGEPLCRANITERAFVAGLKLIEADIEKSGAITVSTILKGATATYISEVTRRLVDLDTLCRSKLAMIEKEKGKDSTEWKAQNCILTGVDLAIAQIDQEGVQQQFPAAAPRPPQPSKPKKKGGRK